VPGLTGLTGSACQILYISFARFLVARLEALFCYFFYVFYRRWNYVRSTTYLDSTCCVLRDCLRDCRDSSYCILLWKNKVFVRRIQRLSEEFPSYFLINKISENIVDVPEVVNFRQQLRHRLLSKSITEVKLRRTASTLRLQWQHLPVSANVSLVDSTDHRWSASVV